MALITRSFYWSTLTSKLSFALQNEKNKNTFTEDFSFQINADNFYSFLLQIHKLIQIFSLFVFVLKI